MEHGKYPSKERKQKYDNDYSSPENFQFSEKTKEKKKIFLFRNLSHNEIERIKVDDVALYSTTDMSTAENTTEIVCGLPFVGPDTLIIDGTAGVGGNTLSFSKRFDQVIAVEKHEARFQMLQNNVGVVAKPFSVDCRHADLKLFLPHIETFLQCRKGILFVDPPWGGPDYVNKESVELYISDLPLADFCNLIGEKAMYIVIKAPVNFAVRQFLSDIKGRCRYHRIHRNLRKMILLILDYKGSLEKDSYFGEVTSEQWGRSRINERSTHHSTESSKRINADTDATISTLNDVFSRASISENKIENTISHAGLSPSPLANKILEPMLPNGDTELQNALTCSNESKGVGPYSPHRIDAVISELQMHSPEDRNECFIAIHTVLKKVIDNAHEERFRILPESNLLHIKSTGIDAGLNLMKEVGFNDDDPGELILSTTDRNWESLVYTENKLACICADLRKEISSSYALEIILADNKDHAYECIRNLSTILNNIHPSNPESRKVEKSNEFNEKVGRVAGGEQFLIWAGFEHQANYLVFEPSDKNYERVQEAKLLVARKLAEKLLTPGSPPVQPVTSPINVNVMQPAALSLQQGPFPAISVHQSIPSHASMQFTYQHITTPPTHPQSQFGQPPQFAPCTVPAIAAANTNAPQLQLSANNQHSASQSPLNTNAKPFVPSSQAQPQTPQQVSLASQSINQQQPISQAQISPSAGPGVLLAGYPQVQVYQQGPLVIAKTLQPRIPHANPEKAPQFQFPPSNVQQQTPQQILSASPNPDAAGSLHHPSPSFQAEGFAASNTPQLHQQPQNFPTSQQLKMPLTPPMISAAPGAYAQPSHIPQHGQMCARPPTPPHPQPYLDKHNCQQPLTHPQQFMPAPRPSGAPIQPQCQQQLAIPHTTQASMMPAHSSPRFSLGIQTSIANAPRSQLPQSFQTGNPASHTPTQLQHNAPIPPVSQAPIVRVQPSPQFSPGNQPSIINAPHSQLLQNFQNGNPSLHTPTQLHHNAPIPPVSQAPMVQHHLSPQFSLGIQPSTANAPHSNLLQNFQNGNPSFHTPTQLQHNAPFPPPSQNTPEQSSWTLISPLIPIEFEAHLQKMNACKKEMRDTCIQNILKILHQIVQSPDNEAHRNLLKDAAYNTKIGCVFAAEDLLRAVGFEDKGGNKLVMQPSWSNWEALKKLINVLDSMMISPQNDLLGCRERLNSSGQNTSPPAPGSVPFSQVFHPNEHFVEAQAPHYGVHQAHIHDHRTHCLQQNTSTTHSPTLNQHDNHTTGEQTTSMECPNESAQYMTETQQTPPFTPQQPKPASMGNERSQALMDHLDVKRPVAKSLDEKKQKPCVFYLTYGSCKKGDQCPYNHPADPKNIKITGRTARMGLPVQSQHGQEMADSNTQAQISTHASSSHRMSNSMSYGQHLTQSQCPTEQFIVMVGCSDQQNFCKDIQCQPAAKKRLDLR